MSMSKAMVDAICSFRDQMEFLTGVPARSSDVKFFIERLETEVAHAQFPQVLTIQVGVMMERTVSGRAEMIEVQINSGEI